MKTGMDLVMYFFIFLVVIAALKNPSGFAKDVTAVGQTGQNFGTGILSQVPAN